MNQNRNLNDLFCDNCQDRDDLESFLKDENLSTVNYVGNVIGWIVKCEADFKKRSFFNYKKVYKRDKYTCHYCGYNLENAEEFRPLHIDHVLPWSASGSNKMDNLVVSCSVCNLKASDKWFNSFNEKRSYVLSNQKKHQKQV